MPPRAACPQDCETCVTTTSLKNLLLSSVLAATLVLSPAAALAMENPGETTKMETIEAEAPRGDDGVEEPAEEAAPADADTLPPETITPVGRPAEEPAPGDETSKADEATYSVTFYHFEMMFYDDPSFVQPEAPELTNLRLIGTQTVDGLKVGDRLNTWDYVGTAPGFTFFDAWPREIVVSEDPAKNAVQLNYFRNTSSVTVNYYHAFVVSEVDEPEATQAGEAPAVSVGNVPVQFTKLGSEVREGELFADVLSGDELAPTIEGMQYAGSWPEEVSVQLDPTRNEINLVYGTAAHLPDDSYAGDDAVNLPDDELAGEGEKPSDRNEVTSDPSAEEPTTQIVDEATPMADGEKRVLPIPQTDDGVAPTVAALGVVAAGAAVVAAFARRRASRGPGAL